MTGDGDRTDLHAAIWAAARELIGAYTHGPANGGVHDYLEAHLGPPADGGGWGVDGDWLQWSFPDQARCYTRSASAAAHWLRLALAADWDRVAQMARDRGLTMVNGLPGLGELLVHDGRFVTLRDTLWIATPDGLYGDTKRIPVTARRRRACPAWRGVPAQPVWHVHNAAPGAAHSGVAAPVSR